RHLQHTALIRPHHELLAGVPEGIRDKYTFLAIADRACNPAVITVDAGSQFIPQRLKGFGLGPKFSKFSIPGLGTRSNQFLHRLVPAGGSFIRLQTRFFEGLNTSFGYCFDEDVVISCTYYTQSHVDIISHRKFTDPAGTYDIEILNGGLSSLGVFQEGLRCPTLLLEFGEISIFIAAETVHTDQ